MEEFFIVQDMLEGVHAQSPFPDVGVTINPRSEVFFGVVDVNYEQQVQAQCCIKVIHGLLIGFLCSNIISGCKNVTGIEAYPDAFFSLYPVNDFRQLFKCMSQAGPLARGCFEQKTGCRLLCFREKAVDGLRNFQFPQALWGSPLFLQS